MLRFTSFCALLLGPLALNARAAEVDKFLPPDTEVVVTINVRQLLGSELLKKAGVDQWKDTLKNIGPVNDVLQDLGFDPFKDLERLTVASPGGAEQDRGLIILRGNFDVAKFKAKADDAAKTNSGAIKVHKIPAGVVYEVVMPDQPLPLFVVVASKNVILTSPGKDYVVDGLKKLDGKTPTLLRNKDMQALLEKMDEKQSLSVAGLGPALAKSGNLPAQAKDALDKLDAIGGGFTVADDIKLEIVLSAKTPEAAKDLDKTITDGLNQALGLVALFAGQKKELAPAIDILKTLRSSSKGKLVTIKAQIAADILDKALDKDK